MGNQRERSLAPRSFFGFLPRWDDVEDRISELMERGTARPTGVTVWEDDKNVYVEADLPGLKQNEIDISIHQNTLWVRGERREEREDRREDREDKREDRREDRREERAERREDKREDSREEEEDRERRSSRRVTRSFFYQVALPAQVEENTEQAQLRDGVLTVTFKRTQASQVRKIPLRNDARAQLSNNEARTQPSGQERQQPGSHDARPQPSGHDARPQPGGHDARQQSKHQK